MPNLKNLSPKYRKHRASGQAVVTLNGRDHYLGPYGTRASKANYDRLIAEWLANGRRLGLDQSGGLSVVELLAEFFRFAKRHYRHADGTSTGMVENFRYSFRLLKQHYGTIPAAEFGPKCLKTLQQLLIGTGLSRRTINDRIGNIKLLFRWAVSEELVPPTIWQGLSTVAGLRAGRTEARESEPIPPVPDGTVEATLPRLPEVVADMVRLQRLTGMRPAEVCIVRPVDIDQTGEVWVYSPHHHKTAHHGHRRQVPIGPRGQAILGKYLDRDPESYCFDPGESERQRRAARTDARKTPWNAGNTIGSNRRKKPKRQPRDRYDTDSYRRAITRAAELAGVESWSPNQLRHTAATEIRRRYGLEAAQVVLGHAAADVTQVYAERDLNRAVEVAKEIG